MRKKKITIIPQTKYLITFSAILIISCIFIYLRINEPYSQNSSSAQITESISSNALPTPQPVPWDEIENTMSYKIPDGWGKVKGSYGNPIYEYHFTLVPVGKDRTQPGPFIQITKRHDKSTIAMVKKNIEDNTNYTFHDIMIGGKEAITYNNKDYNWNYTTNFLIPDGEFVWIIFAGDIVKETKDSYQNYPLLTNFVQSIQFK